MEKGGNNRNKVAVALGTLAAIAMLLTAFLVVWLVPRGPEVGNANVQSSSGTGSVSGIGSGSEKSTYSQAGAQPVAPASDQPRISVRGTGIVSARPDMLNVQVGVQIQNTSLDAAQTDAAAKMDAVLNQLKGAGVDEKDISTAQYNVEPVMNYRDNQPPEVTGYRVTNIVNVKLRDLSKAGKLIDDLVKSGANSIYGMSFGFSDPTALMKQARERAMNDAKTKAGELAALGGVTLGAPIVIDEGFANVPPVPMEVTNAQAGRDIAVSTPVNPGQQEIRVEVTVAYAIK